MYEHCVCVYMSVCATYLKYTHMCCYQWRCHQSGWSGFHLTTFTELCISFIDVRKYRKYFYKYYTQISPINAWMMFTEFNCWSATHKKMLLYSIIFTRYFIHFYACMSTCSIVFSIFAMKCILKLPYLNYSKSLTSQFSTFLRDILARRNLHTTASQGKWFSS